MVTTSVLFESIQIYRAICRLYSHLLRMEENYDGRSVADPAFVKGGVVQSCARNLRSHTHFGAKPRPFSIVLRQTTSPTDPFSNEFSLKHSKVSHSRSFLSSVARKGVPFSSSSVLLSVRCSPKGVHLHPPYPPWIRHCRYGITVFVSFNGLIINTSASQYGRYIAHY